MHYHYRILYMLAFFLTITLLVVAELMTPFPMILSGRFFEPLGWIQITLHGFYASWLLKKFLTTKNTTALRLKVWSLFSYVFFGQLIIGLLGVEEFLQTGTLHYPIPALIVAGPIYRGEGFFMPLLFLSTLVLVGPAWCSYLCYIGVVDNRLAANQRTVKKRPRLLKRTNFFVLSFVIVLALLLKKYSPSPIVLHTLIITFILLSLIFFYLSRKNGGMLHCSSFCPIGFISTRIGRLHPLKIQINDQCNFCQKCTLRCRYYALGKKELKSRRPNNNCTLCLDCISHCHKKAINLSFLRKLRLSKTYFYLLIVVLHSLFLALARV